MNNVKAVHLERLNKLIKYIDNIDGKEISLTRNKISEIVGVKEGDSLKIVFKLLNENPELYSNSFTFKKDNRINTFFKKIMKRNLKRENHKLKKKKNK